MRYITLTAVIVVALTMTAFAAAQHVKTFKSGGSNGAKVMAPAPAVKQLRASGLRFTMHPGPTTYKFKPMPGPTTY